MELIDRQMLISHLADWRFAEAPWSEPKELPKEYTALDMQRMIYRTIGDAMSAVDDAPTIEAEPVKHGQWMWNGEYYCSECKGKSLRIKYAYCPHCGAKMDLDGERKHDEDPSHPFADSVMMGD